MSIPSAKIDSVISSLRGTLIVFYTNAHCWQFRVVAPNGDVFGESKMFYSSDAALRTGREWMGTKN